MFWEILIAGAVTAGICALAHAVRTKRRADAYIETLKRLTEETRHRERLRIASMRVRPRHADTWL